MWYTLFSVCIIYCARPNGNVARPNFFLLSSTFTIVPNYQYQRTAQFFKRTQNCYGNNINNFQVTADKLFQFKLYKLQWSLFVLKSRSFFNWKMEALGGFFCWCGRNSIKICFSSLLWSVDMVKPFFSQNTYKQAVYDQWYQHLADKINRRHW